MSEEANTITIDLLSPRGCWMCQGKGFFEYKISEWDGHKRLKDGERLIRSCFCCNGEGITEYTEEDRMALAEQRKKMFGDDNARNTN